MIIERIEIKNFRSLKDISIACNDSTYFLGRNGSGKSSILRALDIFYNASYQANEYDYFAKDTQKEIRIQVTYTDLREDEKEMFPSYISDSKLTVTKIITIGGSRYVGVTNQVPEFVDIRPLSAREKSTRLNELIVSNQYEGLGPKVTSGAAADILMEQYEISHPEHTHPFEKTNQFFGAKNVGVGLLDKYTKFVLIPAVRDAIGEIERKGVIYQLIDVLVSRSVSTRPDVQALNAEFEARVKEVYNKDNLTELGGLADLITKSLKQYAPESALHLDFGDVIPPKINLPEALATLVEDNFQSPIGYCGHGVQRALIIALLQQLSITDLSPPIPDEGDDFDVVPVVDRPSDLILAIEEPELYLHPSRSRALSNTLEKLSKNPDDPDIVRTQIMYATHSPYFIDLAHFERIQISRKILTEDYDARQCQITAYTRDLAIQRLAKISEKDPDKFRAESFIAHISPVMTSIVNEGFFADVVVVVEGFTEIGVLWAMQEIMGKAWDSLGIVVVSAGGKNNIDRPVVIFEGFKIPTYFIFDGDSNHKGKEKEKNSANKNKCYQTLAGAVEIKDFPDTQVNKNWAVFNNDIETEFKIALGDTAYEKLRQQVSENLGYDEPSKVLKNVEGAAAFIENTYANGLNIPVLENIVEHITKLRN